MYDRRPARGTLGRIFTYVVTHDSGYAPNPFHRWCTLACCKPVIRSSAEKGDWVVGITSKTRGHLLVYAMRVDEVLEIAEYWKDRRFLKKRPRWLPDWELSRDSVGDNCYEPVGRGRFLQHPCRHSRKNGRTNGRARDHDVGGKYVLVSKHFSYFGDDARPLPAGLPIPGRGHRVVVVDGPAERRLVARLEKLKRGLRGPPRSFVKAGVAATCPVAPPRCD